MTRIHVICEGQSEEMFINEVLRGVFQPKEIYLYPSLVGRPGHKGGNVKFQRLLTDISIRLKGDTTAYCTTFFDFYGLPQSFPGKQKAQKLTTTQSKSDFLLQAFSDELNQRIDSDLLRRFIPYVQMYEFEGLLFSDPQAFAKGIDQEHLASDFAKIRAKFQTPEDINDSSSTAPSKRVQVCFSQYEKPTHGSLAAMEVGVVRIRAECPLFDGWLTTLESLSEENG